MFEARYFPHFGFSGMSVSKLLEALSVPSQEAIPLIDAYPLPCRIVAAWLANWSLKSIGISCTSRHGIVPVNVAVGWMIWVGTHPLKASQDYCKTFPVLQVISKMRMTWKDISETRVIWRGGESCWVATWQEAVSISRQHPCCWR